jgi:hypothetical protein
MKGFGVFVDDALSKGNQIVLIQTGFSKKSNWPPGPAKISFGKYSLFIAKNLNWLFGS